MKLSITSNAVYGVRTGDKVQFLPEQGIAKCAEAGFRCMEYNFLNGPANDKVLASGDWRDRVARIDQVLKDHKITVPYTHDYWYLLSAAAGLEDIAHKDEMVRRSVEASRMLGSRKMVVHTQSVYDADGYNQQKTWEYNMAFFSEMGELAAAHGMELLVENLFPIAGAIDFSSYAEELAELMQKLNDPMFGICWDFGHANMAKLDHEKALETVAPWLRLIHVDDNHAKTDDHTVPGYGNIPWEPVMQKLKAIGYTGDLNLSVRTFARTTLPEQQVLALKYLHSVGTDLIRMFEEA